MCVGFFVIVVVGFFFFWSFYLSFFGVCVCVCVCVCMEKALEKVSNHLGIVVVHCCLNKVVIA